MGIGKPPNPHRDEIRRVYLEGERKKDISKRLGVSIKTVAIATADLPPAKEINPPMGTVKPLGKIGLKDHLTQDQKRRLDVLATKWECETLAEAALEILRDALEEM